MGQFLRFPPHAHHDAHVVVHLSVPEVGAAGAGHIHSGNGIHVVHGIRRGKGHDSQRNIGPIVVHLIRQLADIVLHAGVFVQIEHGEPAAVLVEGIALILVGPVCEGDNGGAVPGAGHHVVDHALRGIGFRSLQEMGQRIPGDKPAFQYQVPHPDRGQNMRILFHGNHTPFFYFTSAFR